VAADVLERLLQTAGQDDACFEVRGPTTRVPRRSGASSRVDRGPLRAPQVAAVVSQPGKAKGRGRTIQPTPVTAMALEYGVAEELIFTPLKAREVRLQGFEDRLSVGFHGVHVCTCSTL
jgi:methionyl-tRNA formyltransferase